MTHEELQELIARAEAMPYNKAASQLWAQAVMLAEDLGETELLVHCLMELQTSYHSGEEITRALAPFLRAQKLYAEHPEAFDDRHKQHLAWCYRYALGAMRCVPEVPLERITQLRDQAHEYYLQLGDSCRALYQIDYGIALMSNDVDAQDAAHLAWRNAEQTELSNCAACDPEFEVDYLIQRGRWEDAIEYGRKHIDHDGPTCLSQPQSLLTTMLEPYLQLNRTEEAWNAHLRAFRRIEGLPAAAGMVPMHIRALVGLALRDRPDCAARAGELFMRYLPWWTTAESPRMLLDFAATGAMATGVLPPDEVLPIILPGSQLQWQPMDTVENPTAAQAHHWCKELALALAERFDSRPGLVGSTMVQDFENTISRLRVPEASYDVVDVTGLLLENQVDEDSEDYPELPQLHQLADASISELIAAHEATGAEWSSFLARAYERGYSPAGKQAESVQPGSVQPGPVQPGLEQLGPGQPSPGQPGPEHPGPGQPGPENPDTAEFGHATGGDCVDPAYERLTRAQEMLENRQYMEAASAVDELLHEDPAGQADALGVRLMGLNILAIAASHAGYVEEAIASLRERINLCAAAGLRGEQLDSALGAANGLVRLRKIADATTVLHSVIAAVQGVNGLVGNAFYGPLVNTAVERYVELLILEEDFHTAATQLEALADSQPDSPQKMETMMHAAQCFARSFNFAEAANQLALAIKLADEKLEPADRIIVRAPAGWQIASQPGVLSPAQEKRLHELAEERLDILRQHPDAFAPSRDAKMAEGDIYDALAQQLLMNDIVQGALDAARKAIDAFCQAGAKVEAAAFIGNLVEVLVESEVIEDFGVVAALLDEADALVDDEPHVPTEVKATLHFLRTRVEERQGE